MFCPPKVIYRLIFLSTLFPVVISWILTPGKTYQSIRIRRHAVSSRPSSDAAVDSTVLSSFPSCKPPYLAIITTRDSCNSNEHLRDALKALKDAVSTRQVDLVSVRINVRQNPAIEDRVFSLTQKLMEWSKEYDFRVVVCSDWLDVAIRTGAHGVHLHPDHLSYASTIRQRFAPKEILLGTSVRSLAAAEKAYGNVDLDYLFVGTCYFSEIHPEKVELEGPTLPGIVRRRLSSLAEASRRHCPQVFAIGGIDDQNCFEPIKHGADGVVAIKAVLQTTYPRKAVQSIRRKLIGTRSSAPAP